ncbi:MAG TPA: isochorismatase family cysteine hydrolase [Nitrososphaeraceae archaeon]|nr:isochorismatase family cysteine hydrolase [Nitrososphaeraceae archaeon]
MQETGDKIVYNTIDEILEPKHTALVVWDVINGFTRMIFNKEEFSRNLNSVIELARRSNVPIFFTTNQMLSKRFESSSNIYALSKLGFDRLFEQLTFEDMNFTIRPRYEQNEIVISKHTASIFIDTGFERMLKNARISTVVFTGIATEFGIESSARDAFNRGFYPVVISDCVSSPSKEGHKRSIENMKNLITVITSKEVGNIWSRDKKLFATSEIYDINNGIHHEHIGDASKSDVSPNTPPADEVDL